MLHRYPFRAMGGDMAAILEQEADHPPSILDYVPGWFEEWERILSRFRPDSELSRLNRTFDQPVAVSETMWDVFQYALSAERLSGGLVTPTVFNAVIEAGYDTSFDSLPRYQERVPAPTLTAVNPLSVVIWDESARTLCLPYGVHLDFGGVAKGWAAHQAAERLKQYGPVVMNAAGDIAVSGPRAGGELWEIGVRNPFEPGSDFEVLKLKRCGVATSGKDRRRWSRNGSLQHHIINPITGLPAETDLLTATVLAPTVMEAEAASKTVMILGREEGLRWIESNPALAGLLVLDTGEVLYSQRMQEYL